MSIREADDKDELRNHSVLYAPPDHHLYLEKVNHVSLSIDEEVPYVRPSIDVMFESVAKVFKKRTIGIIFSGANSDGVSGLG